MGFSQSTRARNCNNSVFDEAKEIVQFSNQCLVVRRDALGIQSSFGGYGYGDHKCSTNGPKNKITMIRVVIIGYAIIEGSLEVKLPTIWTDEKQSREEAERRERLEERRVEAKE